MPTLLSLPPSVFSLVLAFSVYDFTQDLAPRAPRLRLDHFKDVALVCKSTLHSVRFVVRTFRASTMNLTLEDSAMAEDVAAMYTKVEAEGLAVRDLRLQVGDFKQHWYGSERRPDPLATERLEIEWETVFEFLPGLRRLDLSKVSLLSQHTVKVLEAATKHCRHLEILVLPKQQKSRNAVGSSSISAVMTAVYAGMERWYSTGGLRQLSLPTRDKTDLFRGSTQYIENVTRLCPRIEYLDGSEKWTISLETWRAFNATCTSLRRFSWDVVPFADPFFHVFGEYVKPRLTSLRLSPNRSWNYQQYFQDCGADVGEVDTSFPGYGVKATDALAVLKACPALTHLHIEINWIENNKLGRQYVDSAVYGDEFWEAVAEHCPLLESIEMMDGSNFQNFNIQSISGLSDRTLQAFANMKSLTSIEFSAARVTGKGVFEWLSRVSKLTDPIGNERTFGLRIGGHQRTRLAPPRFYAEIVEFLKLLSETSEESLGAAACRAKPILVLVNPYSSKVSRAWSGPYMRDELRPLLDSVKAKHPSLGLSVSLFGQNGDKFNRIDTLTLDWRKQERERELFHDYEEEGIQDDIYEDASMYEVVSDSEGDEGGDASYGDNEGGDISAEDLLLWRAILSRYLTNGGEDLMSRFLYNEEVDD